jgi:hypothetical protein
MCVCVCGCVGACIYMSYINIDNIFNRHTYIRRLIFECVYAVCVCISYIEVDNILYIMEICK